jgi:ribosome-associated toxin RatA of RatAB toxin-antitoxin module
MAKAERSRCDSKHRVRWLAILWGVALLLAREVAAEEAAATLRMAASPAQAWEALTDFPAWPAIFPDVTEVDLERVEGRPLRMHQIVRVFGVRIEHTSLVTTGPGEYQLDLHLDPMAPHDVDALDATWTIAPEESGGCVVELRSRFTASQPVPAFIRRRALQRSVRESVEALAAEVTRRSEAPRLAVGR